MSGTVRLRKRVAALTAILLVAGAMIVGTSAAASAQTAPTVTTLAATGITSSSATLNGTVNPNSLNTNYYFQYGPTTSYGSITTSFNAGSGAAAFGVSALVTGLTANTTYYFQLVATNADGTIAGAQVTFFTSSTITTVVSENRVAGNDRYQTSAMIAETKYPGGVTSGNVVVATGADFPDALAGNYLAGQLQAPILLTPSTVLDPAFPTVMAALTALNATHVYILGGTSAVGADVEAALSAKDTVVRIAGNTRFDTMQLIDTQPGYTPGTGTSGARTAIIATGDNFPDALAGGPLSWAERFPLILTDGTQTTLSPQALTVIQTLDITHFLVLGGSSTINPALVTQLSSLGAVDSQFAGVDRTDTAAQFASYEQSAYNFGKTSAILATGADFPDALSAGPWGGDTQSIYFTENADTLGSYTTTALDDLAGTTSVLNIVGGENVVDANAATSGLSALQGSTNNSLAPTVVTGTGTTASSSSATLNGTVNPNGYATTYYFQYGLTSSLGISSTTQTTGASVGVESVSATIQGLATGSTYYFRIAATNIYGTTYGVVQSFVVTNLLTPGVATTAASSIASTSATLNGTVDPDGTATTYYFEYGTTTGYGSLTSATGIGNGGSALPVAAGISGLAPNTMYDFQLVASNTYGTTYGGNVSFTTTSGGGAAPIVSSVNPTGGTTLSGTMVTVNGSNFTGATAVDFGATAGTGVSVNGGGTQLTVTAPAHAAGTIDITVTTGNGTSGITANDQYTYVAAPTMTSAVATTGMYSGGTSSGTTGTVLVTFSEAVSCTTAADYSFANTGGAAVNHFSSCTAVGGAPATQFVLAPSNGTTLTASGAFTYTQAAPTTLNATYAAAGNSQVFETTGDSVAAS